jgi:ELWxxDGT repeat protein
MKLMTKLFSAIAALTLTTAVAQSDYCVYQVDDYYPGSIGSGPYQMTMMGGDMFFAGIDPAAGTELLKYDGSNISLVYDIRPGALNSSPNYLTVMGTNLMFAANDGTNGTELYKYDGTFTVLAADINPGAFHSYPKDLTVVNDFLYFTADDGTNGFELWKYDGVNATLVQDINPGSAGSFPYNLKAVGTNLYFVADNGNTGFELYMYDGSNVTSVDINPGAGSSNPDYFYDWNGTLAFSADNGTAGTELWFHDGTNATMAPEVAVGAPNGNPVDMIDMNGDLVFRAANLTTGSELYKYDGTNITLIADIYPGAFNAFPDNLTKYGTQLVFTANDGVNGYELYKYDGVSVSMIQELVPGAGAAFSANNANDFISVGTKLFLVADNGSSGQELFVYDGNTIELGKDINPGSANANPSEMMSNGGILYFAAEDADGIELWAWRPDAVLADTIQVATCGSYTSPGGTVYNTNGTYNFTDVIPSVLCPGCDSTVTVDLTLTPTDLIYNYTVVSCGPYTSPGGQFFSAVGTYQVQDVFPSVNCPGADSIINIDLEIVQMSTAVTAFAGVLVAQATGAQYQWLDCDQGLAFIPGETNQDFVPSSSGNYAVAVSLGGCVDTSQCYYVEVVGIDEEELGDWINLYPNPAQDMITIAHELEGDFDLQIIDNTGKLIMNTKTAGSNTQIGVGDLARGIYFVILTNDQGTFTEKLLIE